MQQDLELAVSSTLVDVSELCVRDLVGCALGEIKGVVTTVGHDAGAKLLQIGLLDRGREVGEDGVVVRLEKTDKVLADLVLAAPDACF